LERFERFGLDLRICISESLAVYYCYYYYSFIYSHTLRNLFVE
jgi:hypothetical protein